MVYYVFVHGRLIAAPTIDTAISVIIYSHSYIIP